jgi:hypothetical protein
MSTKTTSIAVDEPSTSSDSEEDLTFHEAVAELKRVRLISNASLIF